MPKYLFGEGVMFHDGTEKPAFEITELTVEGGSLRITAKYGEEIEDPVRMLDDYRLEIMTDGKGIPVSIGIVPKEG